MRELRWSMAIAFIGFLLAGVVGLSIFFATRSDASGIGITATAELLSPAGDVVGSVQFTQGESNVLVEAEAQSLDPGGHAFIIHSVGACAPDFSAAGDHFDPEEGGGGFVHPNWGRRDASEGDHGGDLPNLYAAADGTARADYITNGVTLEAGRDHSVFDSDGSSIIIHEHPTAYGQDDSDTGQRVACGVIRRN